MKLGLLFLILFSLNLSATEIVNWPYNAEGCMNIRDNYLVKASTIKRVKFSTRDGENCHVKFGRWVDYFTGDKIKNANNVVLLPVIPIGHIKRVVKSWTLGQLRGYFHDEDSFIILKKGSKQEHNYRSANEKIDPTIYTKCEIVGKWIDAKIKWNIPFLPGEKKRLTDQGLDCIYNTEYVRAALFGTWIKVNGYDCKTRTEVLRRTSKTPVTKMEDDDIDCTTRLYGQWIDQYTGKEYNEALKIDIDHMVPEKNAYQSGAWKWPRWKRIKYSNYMVDPFHLIPVNRTENRKKQDYGPDRYMPPNDKLRCPYVEMWLNIKLRWGLSINERERDFLRNEISVCDKLNKEEMNLALNLLSGSI